jgi:hypothetical protein
VERYGLLTDYTEFLFYRVDDDGIVRTMIFLKNVFPGLSELHIEPKIVPFALMGYIQGEKPMDVTFAAARGAALYARRRQEVQCDCSEPEECKLS